MWCSVAVRNLNMKQRTTVRRKAYLASPSRVGAVLGAAVSYARLGAPCQLSLLSRAPAYYLARSNATYLEDSGVTVEGLKFYGTPWTNSSHMVSCSEFLARPTRVASS